MKEYEVLVVNPGSTSTKISIYRGEREIISENVEHDWRLMGQYGLFDQIPLRIASIKEALERRGYNIQNLDAVISRGLPLISPVVSGVYEVSEAVLRDAVIATRNHACSIGPALAEHIAEKAGIKAYFIHPSNINEHFNLARYSGLKGFEKDYKFHTESQRATAEAAAKKLGRPLADVQLIVAHLGGGISICAHKNGRCIDTISANKGLGPFTGRRTGGLSPWQMMDLCFAQGATKKSVEDILMKSGGLVSYLGTDDCLEIERRIREGDREAAEVYEAMAYSISKNIASLAPAFPGNVDAICLTGGMANSEMLCGWIRERTSFIAPLLVFPGSLEQVSMNEHMQSVLNGTEEAHIYP